MQVVDRGERKLAGRRQGLGGAEADEQRRDEARPARGGDQLDVVERHAGGAQRLVDHRRQQRQVVARRDLRHHPTEAVMHSLRGDDVGADLTRRR